MFDGNWTHYGMMGGYEGGWPWFMGFHGILSIVLLAFIIVVGIALFREWRHRRDEDPALASLADRYLQGEIDRDEYFLKKEDLQK